MLLEYDILHGDVPAIYELGVGEAGKSLIVKVHGDGWEYVNQLLSQSEFPLRDSLREQLELPLFEIPSPESDTWGFEGNIIKVTETRPNWVAWEYRLPQAGKEIDWPKLYAGSASLSLLFLSLGLIEECSGYPKPQLLHVSLSTSKGMHGGSLHAYLGKSFIPWLSSQPDNSFHRGIEQVMEKAYQQMRGGPNLYSLHSFQAWFRKPYWVDLSCPGDACGLDPGSYYIPDEVQGYDLAPHNVDGPLQQITLLMGLAVMHDEVRFAGY